jgi:5-methylcytosine-specific restriction protein A
LCSAAGCEVLTSERFCPEHRQLAAQQYERFRRDPSTAKRYDARWRKIRAAYLMRHPLCEDCAAAGYVTPAREVHHKRPLDQGGDHREENLAALCKPCHSRHTMREHLHGTPARETPPGGG